MEEESAVDTEQEFRRGIETMRPQLEEQRRRLEMPPGQWSDYDIAIMDLRGPLTSMLVAASLLAENEQGNLTESQVHLAGLIMSSGQSLLARVENLIAHRDNDTALPSGEATPAPGDQPSTQPGEA